MVLTPLAAASSSDVPIARGEERRLALAAALPDRPDRVDHVARGQPVALGDPRLAGRTAADLDGTPPAARGPAARWIAPSTPPPPRRRSLAALTIASTFCPVMSPWTTTMRAVMRCLPIAQCASSTVSTILPVLRRASSSSSAPRASASGRSLRDVRPDAAVGVPLQQGLEGRVHPRRIVPAVAAPVEADRGGVLDQQQIGRDLRDLRRSRSRPPGSALPRRCCAARP